LKVSYNKRTDKGEALSALTNIGAKNGKSNNQIQVRTNNNRVASAHRGDIPRQ